MNGISLINQAFLMSGRRLDCKFRLLPLIPQRDADVVCLGMGKPVHIDGQQDGNFNILVGKVAGYDFCGLLYSVQQGVPVDAVFFGADFVAAVVDQIVVKTGHQVGAVFSVIFGQLEDLRVDVVYQRV